MPSAPVPPVVNLVRAMLKLRHATGRELAIVGASWLDAAVQLNLHYNMAAMAEREPDKQVFSRGLRGLEARLWVADSFGLFGTPEIRAQADLVRRVRNEFAHSIQDLTCDSPTIAPLIDQMVLTTDIVTAGLHEDPALGAEEAESDDWGFQFDGEYFDGATVASIGEQDPDRLLFFVPATVVPVSRDDRLRVQIHASVFGVLGRGLKAWLELTAMDGLVDLSGWQQKAALRKSDEYVESDEV